MNTDLKEALESWIVVRSHVPGGNHYIDLMDGGALYFAFGPYENPGIASREAERLRQFIGLLLEAAHTAASLPQASSPPYSGPKVHTTLVTKAGAVEQESASRSKTDAMNPV